MNNKIVKDFAVIATALEDTLDNGDFFFYPDDEKSRDRVSTVIQNIMKNETLPESYGDAEADIFSALEEAQNNTDLIFYLNDSDNNQALDILEKEINKLSKKS